MPKKAKYDVVFWGHVNNGMERYLPIMAELNALGIKSVLFYQNYDYSDGIADFLKELIKKHNLCILDYSAYFKKDIILRIITMFVQSFKTLGIKKFYNKCIGLRSKIIKLKITENNIRNILIDLSPKLSFFDNIALREYVDYPYGSFFISKISRELGIKSYSICTGGSSYLVEIDRIFKDSEKFNFDKIYVPNQDYEAKVYQARSFNPNAQITAFGDPRFDSNWKQAILDAYQKAVNKKILKMKIKTKYKIIYLCPNIECIDAENQKYQNLQDVVEVCKALSNITLLVKPHPRYRNEDTLKNIMKMNNFKDFRILDDDPLICYQEYADLVVNFGTSAVNDVLPNSYKKVIIYDNFFEDKAIKNIFKDDFSYFKKKQDLKDYIINILTNSRTETSPDKLDKIKAFYRRWVCANNNPESITKNIAWDIYNDLKTS